MVSQDDFRQYYQWTRTERSKHPGTRIDVDGLKTDYYIPLDDLKRFWQPDLVRDFLAPTNSRRLRVDDVIDDYLRIFATLVSISTAENSRIGYLDEFHRQSRDDHHLPFRNREDLDSVFLDATDGPKAKNDFYNHQFQFSPRQLTTPSRTSATSLKLHDTDLVAQDILPMQVLRDLNPSHGTSESAAKLKLVKLEPSSGIPIANDTLVAKIFPKDELDYTFRSELNAYSALYNVEYEKASDYFLSYYGSFVQNGIGVILLEYADQGSLLEFFKKGALPLTGDEMFGLWTSVTNLFLGLAELHNLNGWNTHNTLRGVHQDIKPSNIFVFSDGDPSEYKFRFKIGDFGLSSFKLDNSMPSDLMLDSKSTKVYGAPELMTWDFRLSHLDHGVDSSVDMWSLGCVLFELVVWTVCGERGRMEFLFDRQLETKDGPSASASSFHDGKERLQAVTNMANKLLPRRRRYDTLTESLCKWLCDYLLLPKDHGRLPARSAVFHFGKIIEEAKANPYQAFYREAPRTSSIILNHPSLPQQDPAPPLYISRNSNEEHVSHSTSTPPDNPSPPLRPLLNSSQFGKRDASLSSNQIVDDLHHNTGARLNYGTGNISRNGIARNVDHDHGRRTQGPGAWTQGSAPLSPVETPPTSPSTHRLHRRQTSDDHDLSPTPAARHGMPFHSSIVLPEEITKPASEALARPETSNATLKQLPSQFLGPRLPQPPATAASPKLAPTPRTTSSAPSLSAQTVRGIQDDHGVTIKQLLKWRVAKKRGGDDELPQGLRDIPDILSKRDQVFLIDNSSSMLQHWVDVQEVVKALVYVVKNVDPDGVELRFTSRPAVAYKIRNVRDLQDKFSSPSIDSRCMMENALMMLIDSLVPSSSNQAKSTASMKSIGRSLLGRSTAPAKTGISVYILTNGIWTGSGNSTAIGSNNSGNGVPMCGVDGTIRTLIERLKGGGHHRAYVTLQFIRFGRDQLGKRRLRYLDNEIEETSGWDIVDRRHHGGAMRPMLIGAIDEQDYPSDDSDDEMDRATG